MSQFASIIRKYLSILSVILIFGCAKEPEFDAPMVQTGSVTQITEQGVTLVGLVTYAGRGDAEVGFVWDVNPNPIVGTASKVSLPNVSKGAIEARVTYGLENLVTYYVRAYGKSGNQMVYGESTSFISLGSQIPTISGFSPLQGGAGTTITITGNNFSNTVSNVQVKLSGISLVVLSSSGSSIQAQIPSVFNFSGPLPLTVTISNASVTAAQLFTVFGPLVTGFTPNKGIGGDTLTVSGIGFSSTMSQNAVWIGPTKLTLLTASANKLKAILPLDIVPIEDRVYVYVNLIRCESQANFTVGMPWQVLATSQIKPDPAYRAVQFLIGSNLFTGVAGSNTFYKYNPSLNIWTTLATYPGSGTSNTFGFSLGDKGYMGLGNLAGKDVWEYNSQTNNWAQLPDFPGVDRLSPANFVVNGKAYVGLGQSGGVDLIDFYEFNPGTGGWTRLGDFPGTYARIDGSFVLGSKCYVTANKNFWVYDPATDHWQQLGATPSVYARQSLASVDGIGLLIGGFSGSGTPLEQVWEYHPQSDTWQRRPGTPAAVSGTSAIGIDGKIYAIGGSGNTGIYIYNPNP